MPQEGSTTVDRSVRVLFELAGAPQGLTVSELARRLDTQRPPLYRQLKSLLDARLIRRGENKAYQLGVGVLELARSFSQPLSERVRPALQDAADATGFSASLAIEENGRLVIAVSTAPRGNGLHLRAGVGFAFPPAHSAPAIAAAAARPFEEGEHPDITETRKRGWTGTSTIPSTTGAVGVAVPIMIDGMAGTITLLRALGGGLETPEEERALAEHLVAAKRQIEDFSL